MMAKNAVTKSEDDKSSLLPGNNQDTPSSFQEIWSCLYSCFQKTKLTNQAKYSSANKLKRQEHLNAAIQEGGKYQSIPLMNSPRGNTYQSSAELHSDDFESYSTPSKKESSNTTTTEDSNSTNYQNLKF